MPIDGGVSTPGSGNGEVCLDIEMVMSMAPGLSRIYVYEAPNPSPWVDLLSRMANDNLSKQLSCSWGGGSPDATAEQIFKQMAAQGQSFFNATGDSDAFTGAIEFPSDSTNITQVGGTTLTTGTGAAYASETVWNWGLQAAAMSAAAAASAPTTQFPSYQQGISMSANQGSTTMRNVPDVALTADNVYVVYDNGSTGTFGGTSCAAPLWAGFTALVNQQAAAAGRAPVGFLNPALYTIGRGRELYLGLPRHHHRQQLQQQQPLQVRRRGRLRPLHRLGHAQRHQPDQCPGRTADPGADAGFQQLHPGRRRLRQWRR